MLAIRLHDLGIMCILEKAISEILIVLLFDSEIKVKSFLRHSITGINSSTTKRLS